MAILLGVSPGTWVAFWVHFGLVVVSLCSLDLAVLPRVCLGIHISLRVPEYGSHPLGLSGHDGPPLGEFRYLGLSLVLFRFCGPFKGSSGLGCPP